MIIKRSAILVGVLLAGISGKGQLSDSYPKSKGIVSDYAGKLTEEQISELTGLNQRYESKTSIRIAVVVVDNLQGQTARNYAIGLGNSWGVSKPGRDNGIVLLWAPNERAYSLRIASGLTADIDADAAMRITQQNLLPNFKSGQYYGGLKAAVLAVMSKLGDQTWDERMQARAQQEERKRRAAEQAAEQQRQAEAQRAQDEAKRAQEQARRDEENQRIYLVILVALPVAGLAGFAIYKWRDRRKKLEELAQASPAIFENLAKAEANVPQIQRLLDDFSKEAPEQDISALRTGPAAQPERIAQLKLDATLLDFNDLKSYEEMLRIKNAAEGETDLLAETQQKIANIRAAKARSQAMIEQLSQESFAIADVRDNSRRNEIDQMLLRSRQDYEQARQNSSMFVVDWLIINEMLNRSQSQAREAVVVSQQAPYIPPPTFSSGWGSGSNSGGGDFIDSDSSSSSFDSSSSSSSISDSGGFSGGSGSDGSY